MVSKAVSLALISVMIFPFIFSIKPPVIWFEMNCEAPSSSFKNSSDTWNLWANLSIVKLTAVNVLVDSGIEAPSKTTAPLFALYTPRLTVTVSELVVLCNSNANQIQRVCL